MRKFTFLASLAIACTGMMAQAQDEDLSVFISGPFNDFNPNGDFQYALTLDEDAAEYGEMLFNGTFEIPEGQFKINFQYIFGSIVPGEWDDDEIVEAGNVNVFEDDTFFYGEMTLNEMGNSYWICENWQGGTVEIQLDMVNQGILIMAEGEPAPDIWYVRGKFNDFDPAGDPAYALTLDEDAWFDEGEFIYKGLINVPAGEFSFNLLNPYGMIYIPESIQNEEITFTDGQFTGGMDYAFSDEEYTYTWNNPSWEGGQLYVSIDINNSTITMIEVPEEIVPDDIWYVRGEFNDFDPAGDKKWALLPVEDNNGVYTGTFDIPADEFVFNLVSPQGTVFIPFDLNTVEIDFTDEGEYKGMMDMAYDESEESFYWTYPYWMGANVVLTVDANTGELFVNILNTTGINSVSNDKDAVIYNLNGVRVDRNKIDKGIYIIDGKKVIF